MEHTLAAADTARGENGVPAVIAPGPLSGRVRAIPSKSYAHRILLACALGQGKSEVCCPEGSADIRVTAACLGALGAGVESSGEGYTVTGPLERGGKAALFCGNCAAALRFLLPVVCALGGEYTLAGEERLLARPLSPLWEELERHGAVLAWEEQVISCRGRLRAGAYTLRGDVSSQFVGGLLFALPLLAGESTITLTGAIESAPYIHMTLEVLEWFGVKVFWQDELRTFTVPGNQQYRTPGSLAVEGDWSSAAFWLAAGALGGPVTVEGLNLKSRQGDRRILELLEKMGACVCAEGDSVTVGAGVLRGVEIDVAQIPDLAPILCVAAAGAAGQTRLSGAGRLRWKESDRMETITRMLLDLGGRVQSGDGEIRVLGAGMLKGGTVEGSGDHRIVMSAAVAACLCRESVVICGAEAADKSYPRFFRDLKALGGRVRKMD